MADERPRGPSVDRDAVARSWRERGFSCGLWVDPPGQVWTDYVHDVDELVMIVEGDVECEIDGKAHRLMWRGGLHPGSREAHGSEPRSRRVALAVRLSSMKMRVLLHKISDDSHVLEIVHADGRRERDDCETRSYLQHDLLHYAAEGEVSLGGGFWGSLASGRTLAEMNDRAGSTPMYGTSEMMVIEQVVGALSGVMKGRTPEQIVTGLRSYAQSLGENTPAWLTTGFVTAVQERMRQLPRPVEGDAIRRDDGARVADLALVAGNCVQKFTDSVPGKMEPGHVDLALLRSSPL